MKRVDFGKVAEVYAKWRDGIPESVFDRLLGTGVLDEKVQVVDLGCGTGLSSRDMAMLGCLVTGVDPSAEMLEEARKLDAAFGLQIRYIHACAEETGLPDASCDAVTAFRAWHWFDRTRATQEANRLLKRGGWLVVSNSVFAADKHPLLKQTMEIIAKHSPDGEFKSPGSLSTSKARKHGFPAEWFDDWERAGFRMSDAWETAYTVPFSHEGWRGKVQSMSNLAAMSPEGRNRVDEELKKLLEQNYAGQALDLPHICSTVVLRKR
ncbi:class I SAM-dependent methyltransferase [Staphylospora marina]|uniref:class I SAM-dependent methyltransferase n=1 Tax=Staphylospora marina TaxID=2490858 RepID=UPI000F5B9EF2|nr:class I SAM-dependent methyltransferase [Staphylospora marina]